MPLTQPTEHTTTMRHVTLRTDSAAATFDLGRRLGMHAAAGQVIALSGDLGAGKTTLTQGIAAGLGLTASVTSPTFTLVNELDAGTRGLRLVHIDVYRLGETPAQTLAAVTGIGLDEILNDAALPGRGDQGAVVVIEWAERILAALPEDFLHVELVDAASAADIAGNEDPSGETGVRVITLRSHGAQSDALLAALG